MKLVVAFYIRRNEVTWHRVAVLEMRVVDGFERFGDRINKT